MTFIVYGDHDNRDQDPPGGQKVGRGRSPRGAAVPPIDTATRNSAPRCFGYTRVSTDEQATNGQSLAVQESTLRGRPSMHGRSIDEVVREAGVSGGKEFARRPEGARLWAELCRGDTLVATKIDRLSRNLFDCLALSKEFQSRGVSLYLPDVDAGDPVTGNGKSKMFLSMLGAYAEFERDRISERIRETKQAQKARGEYLGGKAPFGWIYDEARKPVAVPDRQRVLRRIRKLAAEGLSPRGINADLAERGIRLSHMGVRKVLRRTGA